MAGEPSLSEITSIKGDAAVAGGTAGAGPAPVIFPSDESLQYLEHAAQARSAYNKYLGESYQNNVSSAVKNLNSFDLSKVLPNDLPALRNQWSDLAADVSDNFDVIRNPNSNPQKYADLMQKENALRESISVSEGHNGVNTYNKNFLMSNPDWNTPENQKRITDFQNTTPDQRKDYLLSAPNDFDINSIAKVAQPIAAQTIKQEAISHDKKWLTTTEGLSYSKEAYVKAFNTVAKNTFKNGRSLYDKFQDNFNMMPEKLKDPNLQPQDYFNAQALGTIPQGSSSSTFVANPYAIQQQSQNFQASEAEKARDFQAEQNRLNRDLQNKLLKKGEIDPNEAADAVMRTVASAYTSGNLNPDVAQKMYGDNSKIQKTVRVIGQDATGAPMFTTEKVPVNAVSVTGTSIDDKGNLHIHRQDNASNQPLPDLVRNYNDGLADFSRMFGDNYAPQLSGAIKRYNAHNFKKETPLLQELQEHFSVPKEVTNKYQDATEGSNIFNPFSGNDSSTGKPTNIMSDDDYNSFLRKKGLIK